MWLLLLLAVSAVLSQNGYGLFTNGAATEGLQSQPGDASMTFPTTLSETPDLLKFQYPITYQGCGSSITGDPVFVGFHGQRFLVKGLPDRVYNLLSLPSLQLNSRFIPLARDQALNNTEQVTVRQRQSKLIAALRAVGSTNTSIYPLPSTASWSHAGQYMGSTAAQIAGHRLLVAPGAYAAGFSSVQLDGSEVAVSSEAVLLSDGSTVRRPSSSVLDVRSPDVAFSLVNSDHFLNIHSATLHVQPAAIDHIDGLLGQTASADFTVDDTKDFKRHLESDLLLPEGADDLWSTDFQHNRYVMAASVN